MQNSAYKKTILALSVGGLCFSGYLSAIKLFTATCAFNEQCPYFLGYPTCWYGFGIFLALSSVALAEFAGKMEFERSVRMFAAISAVGILFAGYFTIPELSHMFSGAIRYSLGLPTCAYGLVFYIIIFALSMRQLMKNRV